MSRKVLPVIFFLNCILLMSILSIETDYKRHSHFIPLMEEAVLKIYAVLRATLVPPLNG